MSWIWSRGAGSKKSARATVTRSESDIESKFIQSDIHDVVNPLTWSNQPEIVREALARWKDDSFSRSEQIEGPAVQNRTSQSSPTTPMGVPESLHSPRSAFGTQHRPPGTLEYKVEKGDTLNTVALKFDMTPSQLAHLNKYGFNTIIHPGMTLYVLDPDCPVPVKPTPKPAEPSSSNDTPLVVVTNTSKDFVEELSKSHMKFKAKYLTKDVGCARGFILLTSQSLVFQPFDDDPLVLEKSPTQYEVVLFLQHVVYAAIAVQLEGIPQGSAFKMSPLSPAAKALSSIQPPHPLPGRAVRNTSPHPTHKDNSTLDREQPVAGTSDANNADECNENGECEEDSLPMDDPLSDDPSDEEGDTDKPTNPLLPDYPVLLLKNLYSDKKPAVRGSPHSQSAMESALNEPPAELAESDEVFGDREGTDLLGVKGSEGPGGNGEGVGDDGDRQDTDGSAASRQSAVEGTPALSAFGLPKFLHIRMSCESDPTFTPMVHGMSIPGRHFKHDFWFAIPEDRVHHVIQFFLHHHPRIKLNSRHEWVDGKFVMVDVDKDNELQVASDHFGDVSSSEPWEVLSFKDIVRVEPRGMQVENDLPLPTLSEESQLMSDQLLGSLNQHMILRGVGLPWELGYSTFRDGISLHTLYRRLSDYDCPNVLIIKDEAGNVFGAVLPYTLKRSERYFGNGETFLFSCLGEECKFYNWSGVNEFFIKGDKESFMLGGGDGRCGLWVDERLLHGSSSPCQTFDNECLSTQQDFVIVGVEVWCLVS